MYMQMITLRTKLLFIVLAVVLVCAQPVGADGKTQTIVLGGDAAPDGNGLFGSLSDINLNTSGQVAFRSLNMTGTSGGASDNDGVFRGSGGAVTEIAREGQAVPGGNGLFGDFNDVNLNTSGQVAFGSFSITGTSGGTSDDTGVFRGSGGAVTEIARKGQAAPGGNGLFGDFNDVNLNTSGQVAFRSFNMTGTSGGFSDNDGLFRGIGGAVTEIAREGQAVPGGNGFFGFFSKINLNTSGLVAFRSFSMTGTSGGFSDNDGVFRGSGGAVTEIARKGQAAPGGNGLFGGFDEINLNTSGLVAFRSFSMTGTSGGGSDNDGVFRGSGGAVTEIARKGQAAPGGNGLFGFFSKINLNTSGQVAFESFSMTGTSGGSSDNNGVFRGSGGAVTEIAREGQAAPGGNGLFGGFSDINLNTSGQVAFESEFMTGTSGGFSDDNGVFLGDGIETLQVVREGDDLAGSVATAFSEVTLNDFGQVAYRGFRANGLDGIFLFTPDLHWRGDSFDDWDTGNNWTVGLNPGDPHKVFIDRAGGGTVNGPAGSVNVSSLDINAKVSGIATLRMNGGGDITVANGLTIGVLGQLDQEGGTFSAGAASNAGTLNQDAGTLNLGSLTNTGSATFDAIVNVAGTVDNQGTMTVNAGAVLGFSGLLSNLDTLNMNGGTINTGITLQNEFGAQMNARGTVDALQLVNNGTLNTTGLLTVTGLFSNTGQLTVQTTESLHVDGSMQNLGTAKLDGGALSADGGVFNSGVIELAGGAVEGSGDLNNQAGGIVRGNGTLFSGLTNDAGLVHANSGGNLLIATFFGGNINGGEVRIEDGSSINAFNGFASSGTVVLKGNNATLSGGALSNTGTVSGVGRVTNTLINAGTVRAEGGKLTLSGAGSSNTGSIQAGTASEVFYSQGLATNSGTIALTGGTFDNGGNAMTNAGSVLGHGTLRTGGLTNDDTVHFADGDAEVFGTVLNNAQLSATSNTTTFFNEVTNSVTGVIKNTEATLRFLGGLNNSGTFISDPADNFFTDLIVNDPGTLIGGVGDRFLVSGNYENHSLNNTGWETSAAELVFHGTIQEMHIGGTDLGASLLGYVDNFAWGILTLEAGVGLTLFDGNATSGGAVYAGFVNLADGVDDLAMEVNYIFSDFDIYYDMALAGNAYLGGLIYALNGTGVLAPLNSAVPLPPAVWLFGSAMIGLSILRRRNMQ